jgi:hypothetical protein
MRTGCLMFGHVYSMKFVDCKGNDRVECILCGKQKYVHYPNKKVKKSDES